MNRRIRTSLDRLKARVDAASGPRPTYWFVPADDGTGDVIHNGERYTPADLDALRAKGARVRQWVLVTPNHPDE